MEKRQVKKREKDGHGLKRRGVVHAGDREESTKEIKDETELQTVDDLG